MTAARPATLLDMPVRQPQPPPGALLSPSCSASPPTSPSPD